MKRYCTYCLLACGIGLVASGELFGATITGKAFDLSSPPKAREHRNVRIFVTGIGLDPAEQPRLIPLAETKLEDNGTFKVVITDRNVIAVSLSFFDQDGELENIQLDRLLVDKDQAINVSLPKATRGSDGGVVPCQVPPIPCYAPPVQGRCRRWRLFGH